MQEVNKLSNNQQASTSSNLRNDINLERLERIEAEIAYLKDDMVTHA